MIRVGADLRVRPQNRLRSGEDGRTHRSAPTKGYTYHRYTSSASVVDKARRVTRCRDARSERPLYQKLQHRSFNDNGRTDRASLQRVTRHVLTQQYKWIDTKQISSQIGTFVAFRSEHLWCAIVDVTTLTQGGEVAKALRVITEEISDKSRSILQASKRDDLNAIWSGIGHLPTCQDNQEVWLPQGYLHLLFVVFLDESI